jgi:hypothetical protein
LRASGIQVQQFLDVGEGEAERFSVLAMALSVGLRRAAGPGDDVGALRDAGQDSEPRNRHRGVNSQRFEVCEGTASMCSAPMRQIRGCTVASASASSPPNTASTTCVFS